MTSEKDRERLRNLAGKYADLVFSDDMNERREVWRLSNRLERRTVPFVIEDNGSYLKDLTPTGECAGETERSFEAYFLRAITNIETIDDDRIFPPYFPVKWMISRPNMCPDLQTIRVPDAKGGMLGYETNTPLANLETGLDKLRREPFSVDRNATLADVDKAESLFGDLIPVKIINPHTVAAGSGMFYKAVLWMGMDNLYLAMIDQPENVHRLFDFIANEGLNFTHWLTDEKLIAPNSGEYCCGSGSFGYTDELPRRGMDASGPLAPEDCWAFVEAQEAVGLSKEMYAEFIHPYQKRISTYFGLVYYGCCEPVHQIWDTVRTFENLRKITISPWCDQQIMADALGDKYVFSRKPHPMKLCGESFDPNDFTQHVKETLTITENNFVELIFRDTCALNGAMKDRVTDACAIIRKMIDR